MCILDLQLSLGIRREKRKVSTSVVFGHPDYLMIEGRYACLHAHQPRLGRSNFLNRFFLKGMTQPVAHVFFFFCDSSYEPLGIAQREACVLPAIRVLDTVTTHCTSIRIPTVLQSESYFIMAMATQ